MTPSQTAILLLGAGALTAILGIAAHFLGKIGSRFDRVRVRGRDKFTARQGSADCHFDKADKVSPDTPMRDTMRTVQLLAVGLHCSTSKPVMLLQECEPPGRVLPIYLADSDAMMVDRAWRCPSSVRPGTHQLIAELIERSGCSLRRVEIVGLHEGVFYAQVVLDNGSILSARPSDAVSLACHANTSIRSAEFLIRNAGKDSNLIHLQDEAEPALGNPPAKDCAAIVTHGVMNPAASELTVRGPFFSATEEEVGTN